MQSTGNTQEQKGPSIWNKILWNQIEGKRRMMEEKEKKDS